MRKLLLMSFLLPLVINATYVKESDVGACGDGRIFYIKKNKCELDNSPEKCFKLSSDYQCDYNVIKTVDGVKVIGEDSGLKSNFNSIKLKKESIDSQLKNMVFGKILYASIQVLNKSKGLTKQQRRTIRTNLSNIKDDLIDGNICDARLDITAITPDGTLILSSDIINVLAQIDAYKTCL